VDSQCEETGYKSEHPAEPTEDYDAYLELHIEDEYTSWPNCYAAANTYARAAYDLATGDQHKSIIY